ncbi:unnamed protein product [Didymodactylos carnosus]|uniref:NAD(P)(+)--arginine ADP-ribosyltransferase n=1 Tax=Didymodactylos carnosus TaxID=1234261 RepID=A0A814XVL7_9BILA|nr:unnamed protein product [Didymodactylos carnosus]CAF3984387.1 unnamed protein product [Didymodactylos carnosus]
MKWRNLYLSDSNNDQNVTLIVELADKGIVQEGRTISKLEEATFLAEELIESARQSKDELYKDILSIYTRESFLYRLVNKVLRSYDLSKLQTLGPFCYLLNEALRNLPEETRYLGIVYRGAQLDPGQIQTYKRMIRTKKNWPQFTSTSKSRQKAEQFGNALFIINLGGRYGGYGRDVSQYSAFPNQEEVLLPCSTNFYVEKVAYDLKNKKHLIYILGGYWSVRLKNIQDPFKT